MKKILTIGTLLLTCSLFAAAQSKATPDQIDLSSTPCACQQYATTALETSNNQATPNVANPDSQPSSITSNVGATKSKGSADKANDDGSYSVDERSYSQEIHQLTR